VFKNNFFRLSNEKHKSAVHGIALFDPELQRGAEANFDRSSDQKY
jgi:hypothetical protein